VTEWDEVWGLVNVPDEPEPKHDCGEPGRPVDVAICGDCWDYMDEKFAKSKD
jgi:hypothetical protein